MQKGKQNCTITFYENGKEKIYEGYIENPEQFKISEDDKKISLQWEKEDILSTMNDTNAKIETPYTFSAFEKVCILLISVIATLFLIFIPDSFPFVCLKTCIFLSIVASLSSSIKKRCKMDNVSCTEEDLSISDGGLRLKMTGYPLDTQIIRINKLLDRIKEQEKSPFAEKIEDIYLPELNILLSDYTREKKRKAKQSTEAVIQIEKIINDFENMLRRSLDSSFDRKTMETLARADALKVKMQIDTFV